MTKLKVKEPEALVPPTYKIRCCGSSKLPHFFCVQKKGNQRLFLYKYNVKKLSWYVQGFGIMNLREDLEKIELNNLSEFACKACQSRGRKIDEPKDEYRTCFQRDRDRIIHSKALRRLMHKTQVFISPEGDHFRTRLTHTLEVSQIARTISRALNLNEDLTEAIAMGHDLGHTPFGHMGEAVLNEIHPGGFRHNEQSLRVVDVLDRDYKGKTLNLTEEVRDGIKNHSGSGFPFTLEGQVVRLSDRIAYINHDIDDAIRSGIIKNSDIPPEYIGSEDFSSGNRISYFVKDIVNNSEGKDRIILSEEANNSMGGLRSWLFEYVYKNPIVRSSIEEEKVYNLISSLYNYFIEHPDKLDEDEKLLIPIDGINEVVKDHIAGMTDRYAMKLYESIFVPTGWSIVN